MAVQLVSGRPCRHRELMKNTTTDPDWIMDIRPGDVLKSRKTGDLRVVRSVHHYIQDRYPYGYRISISLAIRRCSWTHRCYTVYCAKAEIRRLFAPTGVRVSLNSKLDRQIRKDIIDRHPRPRLTCCDVRGIP